jgi:hypothetical protein
MISILTYISMIAGGFLILLLLLSLVGGMDLEFDLADGDADSGGGLGIIKGGLTFISVSSWVARIIIHSSENPIMAAIVGTISGIIAVIALSYFLRFLLRAESEVNWSPEQALYNSGKVYLKIPSGEGYGLVHTLINGTNRELKAKSINGEIPTGSLVYISDIENDILIVSLLENTK